jgi:hypothetical protein
LSRGGALGDTEHTARVVDEPIEPFVMEPCDQVHSRDDPGVTSEQPLRPDILNEREVSLPEDAAKSKASKKADATE